MFISRPVHKKFADPWVYWTAQGYPEPSWEKLGTCENFRPHNASGQILLPTQTLQPTPRVSPAGGWLCVGGTLLAGQPG